ncbi:membrane protein [Acrocarpospora phusangensis]|uniref:Membrane protein n=1 Tax=Acrocarpospora phusangensis TaxID=1070424 RepID=A0A919UMR8_9ACTN|nr:membrane protein [Acrocarpospora phusangensis]
MADVVLEGGGVKGIGLVGALSALTDADYRFGGPGRVAGTSAGAIVGALLAAGMPQERMNQVIRELDYRSFRDGPPLGLLGRAWSLIFHQAMYRGDYLREWIAGHLEDLGVRTFADLRLEDPGSDLPPERAYKLLVIVSDVANGRMVRLPWDYAHYGLDPDEQSVADAVRASAAIPFYFRPVRLLRRPGGKPVALYVDGGMLSNYPVTVFDRRDTVKPRWPTFGIKLSAPPPNGPWGSAWAPIAGPVSMAKALVTTMVNAHDRLVQDEPAVTARTIFVASDEVSATDFSLGDEARDQLFRNGQLGVKEFLARWDFEKYLAEFRDPERALSRAGAYDRR